jgi:phosphoglycerate dehydrogenase-like enzyme
LTTYNRLLHVTGPVIVVKAPNTALPPEFDRLREVAELIEVDDEPGYRAALTSGADTAFVWDDATGLVRAAGVGELGWIHTNSVGVNAFQTSEVAASRVLLTNTRGVFEPPMAEFVLMALLYFTKDVRRTVELQRTVTWSTRPTETLRSRRVLILGPGGVGREIATLLRAIGIRVDVVGRTGRSDPDMGTVHPLSELDALLPHADDIVVALPLTAQTRGLIDADRLARLRRGARLINVGRGPIVDEKALLDALRSGHLSGAALDVFDQEPLPSAHPFWAMDNVLVSPHMSGDVVGWQRASVQLFIDNLDRWRRCEPLQNVVDKSALIGSPADGTGQAAGLA